MTNSLTRTPLSGVAMDYLTSGLLLGFPDAAWYGQPNPFPSFFPFALNPLCVGGFLSSFI
jgi:hypothetical protein